MLVYSRTGSQYCWYVPSQLSGQSPWIVHELFGPVAGFVSQNCVCKIKPPGVSKQHVSWVAVVLWQDSGRPAGQLKASYPVGDAAEVLELDVLVEVSTLEDEDEVVGTALEVEVLVDTTTLELVGGTVKVWLLLPGRTILVEDPTEIVVMAVVEAL